MFVFPLFYSYFFKLNEFCIKCGCSLLFVNLHSTLRGTVYQVESALAKMKTLLIALGVLLCVAYADAGIIRFTFEYILAFRDKI